MSKGIQKVSDLSSSAVTLVGYVEEVNRALGILLKDLSTLATTGAGTLAQLMACKEAVDNAVSVATVLSLELAALEVEDD